MSKIGVEALKSYMHLHEKCTCSRCLMFVKYVATPKAPLGAMLRLRRSAYGGPVSSEHIARSFRSRRASRGYKPILT